MDFNVDSIIKCKMLGHSPIGSGGSGGDTTYPSYMGAYSVEPDVEDQVLLTKKHVMEDNLTVQAIPLHEVSNQGGGTTVVIGGKKYGV